MSRLVFLFWVGIALIAASKNAAATSRLYEFIYSDVSSIKVTINISGDGYITRLPDVDEDSVKYNVASRRVHKITNVPLKNHLLKKISQEIHLIRPDIVVYANEIPKKGLPTHLNLPECETGQRILKFDVTLKKIEKTRKFPRKAYYVGSITTKFLRYGDLTSRLPPEERPRTQICLASRALQTHPPTLLSTLNYSGGTDAAILENFEKEMRFFLRKLQRGQKPRKLL